MIALPYDTNYMWGDIQVGVWNKGTAEFIEPVDISTLTDDTIIDRRVREWENGPYLGKVEIM